LIGLLMAGTAACGENSAKSTADQPTHPLVQQSAPVAAALDPIAELSCVEREDPNDRSDWYVRITPAVELGPVRIGAPESELRTALPDIGECKDPDQSMYCDLGPLNGFGFTTDRDRVIGIRASRKDGARDSDLPVDLRFGTSMFEALKTLCESSDDNWVVRTLTSSQTVVLNLALLAYPNQPERFTMGLVFEDDVLERVILQEIEDYGAIK
jgi:hypothetical protein